MATITISPQDKADAEDFLEQFLRDRLNGDFSPGSFLRDIVITAVAYTVAFLRAENDLAVQRSAVKRLLTMVDGTDRDDAADDAMSNWFISRKSGRPSRGPLLVHLSDSVDTVVPLTTKFFYSSGLAFVPDPLSYDTDVFVPKEDLILVADASAAIADRYFVLNVVATQVGSAYDVTPATWLSSDKFSPFITKLESTVRFVGGSNTETTDDLLARAPAAVTVRDLNTDRSIRTVLKDNFSSVDDVVVIGAGDAEMQRDLVVVSPGGSPAHTGGSTDIYLHSPAAPAVAELAVGGAYTDPRPEITVFTDATVADFTAVATTGSVLRVTNAKAGEPSLFTVVDVKPKYISVSSRNPFPAIRSGISYSIGAIPPSYVDGLDKTSFISGNYTNSIAVAGQVLLPEVPVYRITKASYLDNLNNRVVLTRVNGTPVGAQYAITYGNPAQAFSAYQIGELVVDQSQVTDGKSLRLEYDTLAGFTDVHDYVVDSFNRISCASLLVKGLIPVYVAMVIPYTLRSRATSVLDEAGAAAAVATFVNGFPAAEILNVSDVVTFLQTNYPQVGSVPTFNITYNLMSPTGQVVPYSTADAVVVDPSYETSASPLLPNPITLGISSQTIRFLTAADLITFSKR